MPITSLDPAIGQIPAECAELIELLVRADSAVVTDHCHEGNMRFSFGNGLTEAVRTASLEIGADDWVAALDQDGPERVSAAS